jgi:hypothetical protein
VPQRTERVLRTPFLHRADGGVQREHDQDDGAVDKLAEREDDDRGAEEHIDERARELPEEELPPPRRGRLGEHVLAAHGEPARGLCGSEPARARREVGEESRQVLGVSRYHVPSA